MLIPRSSAAVRWGAQSVALPTAPPAWLPPVPADRMGRPVSWAVVIWEGPLHYWNYELEEWVDEVVDLAWLQRHVDAYDALLAECPSDPHPVLNTHQQKSGKREGDILALKVAWDADAGAWCLIAALAWVDATAPEQIACGKIRNVSAGIGGLITNKGTLFEDILLEVSIVSAGHIRGARVLNSQRGLMDPKNKTPKGQHAEGGAGVADPPVNPAPAPAPAPVDQAAIQAAVASAIGELLPNMLRQLGVLPALPTENPAEEPEADSEMGKRMAAQQRQIDALKAENLAAKKAAFSAAYPKDAALDLSGADVQATLEKIYLEQPEAFAKLEAHIKRPAAASSPAPATPARNPFSRLGGAEGAPAAPAGTPMRMSASQINAECMEAAKGDHKAARLLFRQKLRDYKARGVEIDTAA